MKPREPPSSTSPPPGASIPLTEVCGVLSALAPTLSRPTLTECGSPDSPGLAPEVSLSRKLTRDAISEAARIEALIGPPPDGGREAWLCVFAAFWQQFCIFGLMSANGQLQSYYLANQLLGHGKAQVAWFGSIQTLIEFSFAIMTGRYFDIHGAKLLVSASCVLSFTAIIGMAFSHEYYQFLLSFVLFGASGSLIYAPSAAVASHWFDKRRGLAMGIIVCGSGIGGVLYPIMLENLFSKIGYRNTMLFIGGFNFVFMLPGVFWMKTRLPPRNPPPWKDMLRPWHDARYVVHVIGGMLFGMNILAPLFTAINYAEANGLPDNIAAYAIAILLAGSILGRILFGALADRLGVWSVFGCVGFVGGIIMFGFWVPDHVGVAATIIGLVAYGNVSGAWFALVPAATAAISPVHEAGMRFGMLISALAVPSLVGPVITSALIEKGGNKMQYAAIWCGVCFIISGFIVNAVPAMAWWKRRKAAKEVGGGEVEMGEPVLPAVPPGKAFVEEK